MKDDLDYWKTGNDGRQMTHYAARGDDLSFCGTDLAGDTMVHDKQPKLLSRSKNHRVTCKQCLQQTELAKAFLDRNKK